MLDYIANPKLKVFVDLSSSLEHAANAHEYAECGQPLDRVVKLYDHDQVFASHKRGKRYFFSRKGASDSQPVLYLREGTSGKERILIDPNTWSDDGADALAEWAVSDDGAFIANGVQKGGTVWRTIRVPNSD